MEKLSDQIVALASPAALAVARGQMPAVQQPIQTPAGAADVVDEQGRGYVMYDGQLVPLTEYNRVKQKLESMAAGG